MERIRTSIHSLFDNRHRVTLVLRANAMFMPWVHMVQCADTICNITTENIKHAQRRYRELKWGISQDFN